MHFRRFLAIIAGFTALGPALRAAPAGWTKVDPGLGALDLAGASFANGRYFVGGGGAEASSADGTHWISSPYVPGLNALTGGKVAFGHGIYIAGGGSTTSSLYSSVDGATWSWRSSALPATVAVRVVFDGTKFVALGENGAISTSDDGVNWVSRYVPAHTGGFRDLAFGGGKFVAVGSLGMLISNDGLAWSSPANAELTGWWAITYAEGRFVAVANTDSFEVRTSTDGVTWASTRPTFPDGSAISAAGGNDIAYGGGTFCAISGKVFLTSTDGTIWTATANAFPAQTYYPISITFGNGRFLVAGQDGNVFLSPPMSSAPAVTVVAAPDFVRNGETASLNVSAQGSNLTYQWYSGYSGDTRVPIAGATAPNWTTSPLDADSRYWIRVRSGTETTDSTTILVRVAIPPTATPVAPVHETMSGETVTLTVNVSGAPAPTLQWFQGRRGETQRPVATGASLVRTAGNTRERYWVRATNLAGSVDSAECDIVPWQALPSPTINGARALNGTFIGVGGDDVNISTDGATWTKVASIREAYLRDIAYGADKYVAVGERGFFASADLKSWTPSDSFSQQASQQGGATNVAFGNGKFIAVGYAKSYQSTNGVDWTPIALPDILLSSVLFDGMQFVGVGQAYEAAAVSIGQQPTGVGVVATSSDGVTWTRRALEVLPAATENYRTPVEKVAFADNEYLAIGKVTSTGAGYVLASADAIHWTRTALGPISVSGGSIGYIAGRYLITDGSSGYYVSQDAKVWAPMSGPIGLSSRTVCCYQGHLFAVGNVNGPNDTFVYRTDDGMTWTAVAGMASSVGRVAFAGGEFFQFGSSATYRSGDGVAWTRSLPDLSSQGSGGMAYGAGRWVMSGEVAHSISTSSNGRTWARQVLPASVTGFSTPVYVGGRFFARDSNVGIVTSIDGKSWTESPMPGGIGSPCFAYGNGVYTVAGLTPVGGNAFAWSSDGTNWQPAASIPDVNINGVAFGNGKFVAVGTVRFGGDYVGTSVDGKTWERLPVEIGATLSGLYFSGDRFLGMTASGLAFSLDGVAWTLEPSIRSNSNLIVGNGGAIANGVALRARDELETSVINVTGPAEVPSGQPALLQVTAAGPGPLSYQWYWGESGDISTPLTHAIAANVYAPPITRTSRFWVRVAGPAGSIDSKSIVVPIAAAPLIVRQPFSADFTIGSGDRAKLQVEAISGTPVAYQWYAGEPGDTTQPVPFATGPSLVVQPLTNTVHYWVRLANKHGTTDSLGAEVMPWASTTPKFDGKNFLARGITHDGTRFFVTGSGLSGGEPFAVTSTDGLQWTAVSAPSLGAIVYALHKFVATSKFGGSTLYSSPDGTNWTSRVLTGDVFGKVLFGAGTFVALGGSGGVATSPDGENWTQRSVAPRPLVAAAASDSRVVAVGTQGLLVTSANGTDWSTIDLGTTLDLTAIAYSQGRFFVVLADGSLVTSTDGIGWSRRDIATWNNWECLPSLTSISSANDHLFMDAFGAVASRDGSTWGISNALEKVAFGGGRYVGIRGFNLYTSMPPAVPPTVAASPASVIATNGSALELTVTATTAIDSPAPTYRWRRNGQNLEATTSTFTLADVSPADAGLYSVQVNSGASSTTSPFAIVGFRSEVKVSGEAHEIGTDIRHPNGNIYDQVLLEGTAAAVKADPGQVTRLSFIDLSDDIVQVEFAGAGTLSIGLDHASGPMLAANYNQPSTHYMKGHATIVIVDADATTNVSVFSVGKITAVNQALFRDDVTYDGVADVAAIAILSRDGKFGGLRAADGGFIATQGATGVYAPGVTFEGPVYVSEITASETAVPMLRFGAAPTVLITGGSLEQFNGYAIRVSGIGSLEFGPGTTSQGEPLPQQSLKGELLPESAP